MLTDSNPNVWIFPEWWKPGGTGEKFFLYSAADKSLCFQRGVWAKNKLELKYGDIVAIRETEISFIRLIALGRVIFYDFTGSKHMVRLSSYKAIDPGINSGMNSDPRDKFLIRGSKEVVRIVSGLL